jgi:hypothetical protein
VLRKLIEQNLLRLLFPPKELDLRTGPPRTLTHLVPFFPYQNLKLTVGVSDLRGGRGVCWGREREQMGTCLFFALHSRDQIAKCFYTFFNHFRSRNCCNLRQDEIGHASKLWTRLPLILVLVSVSRCLSSCCPSFTVSGKHLEVLWDEVKHFACLCVLNITESFRLSQQMSLRLVSPSSPPSVGLARCSSPPLLPSRLPQHLA